VGNHWVEIQVWGRRSVTYIGNYLEWTGATNTMKKYYYAGATRAAMREGSSLYYLLGDHLGSTSLVTDPGGVILSAARYDPWGELRAASGPSQTSYGYTGQRTEKGLGLYFYGARWYDPQLSRFLSADSIIPQQQGVQAWDRFAYVSNNPLKYTDPTGHWRDCPGDVNCDGAPRQTPIPSRTATLTPTPTATATVNPTYVAAQMTITASWGYPYTPGPTFPPPIPFNPVPPPPTITPIPGPTPNWPVVIDDANLVWDVGSSAISAYYGFPGPVYGDLDLILDVSTNEVANGWNGPTWDDAIIVGEGVGTSMLVVGVGATGMVTCGPLGPLCAAIGGGVTALFSNQLWKNTNSEVFHIDE